MEKERKNSIIKAAVKRFSKHGVSKTTLDEIARDLRIGKATIYHYFESKDDLYIETLNWEISLFINEIKTIFNNEEVLVKERFNNYYLLKKDLSNKYKLLYELIIRNLKEELLEEEIKAYSSLVVKENEVIQLIVGSLYREKIENMNPHLPRFIIMQSYGLLFGAKLMNEDEFYPDVFKDYLSSFIDSIAG